MADLLGVRHHVLHELELLNEVSRAIIRAAHDVDALCELVYQEAGKLLDTSWFHLALFSGKQYILKVHVVDGVRQPLLKIDLDNNQGLVGWMQRTGRALLVDDFEREIDQLPAQPSYQAEHPPRSGIYVPLLAGDTVLGTISVQSRRSHAFTSDDLRLLSLIADSAAAAIAKARAYDDLRARISQLELISNVSQQAAAILDLDELLPSVVHLIRDQFNYYHVHLFSCDPEAGELVFRASTASQSSFWRSRNQRLAIGEGIVGYVAETQQCHVANDVAQEPRYLLDVPGTQAELALPLLVGEELIGVLDVQSDQRDAFDDNALFVLQTLADQIAVAIQSANAYTEQQEESWTLAALLQSAENIGRASGLEDLLATIVRLPPLLIGSDRCAVLRYIREERTYVSVAAWGWRSDFTPTLIGQSIPSEVMPLLEQIRSEGKPITLQASEMAQLFPQLADRYQIGTVLALPLTVQATVLGVLLLERAPDAKPWTKRQETIATGIASQAASAMQSALLLQQVVEQERLAHEVRVAREIQTSLLPAADPCLPGWDIASAWRSARAVGGDFYDFWLLGEIDDQIQEVTEDAVLYFGLVIADVSDKGVPAALFMALSRSLLRAAALDGSPPAAAVAQANRWIARDSQSGMFVTLFYGLLEPATGLLRYVNGGHNPSLLLRSKGVVEKLGPTGMALGVLEDAYFKEAQVVIDPGDVLVCYTDGVTEAINDQEEQYGVQRLQEVVQTVRDLSAKQIVQAILSDLAAHTGERPAFDDVTLKVLKRLDE
jgi:serine phosphatase RsbU (regulator of sigma subunit)/putative methionine-R-sulfoxide reductase with GAF domain